MAIFFEPIAGFSFVKSQIWIGKSKISKIKIPIEASFIVLGKKAKKNISWYRDTRVMIGQIKHFAKFPPHFSTLWITNNLKLVRDTYENTILDPKQYLPSVYMQEKTNFLIQ